MAIRKPLTTVITVTRTAIYNNLLAANDPPAATITDWINTRIAEDGSFVAAVFTSTTTVINGSISTITTPEVWVSKDQVLTLLGASASGFVENDLIDVVPNVNGTHIDFFFKIKLT